MDNEVENEINAILIEAISNDIQHTIQKSQQATVAGATSGEKSKDQSPSDVPRCSVCCSQKPRYKCPACLMRVSYQKIKFLIKLGKNFWKNFG